MKPAPFTYVAARTVDEAVRLLADNDDAKVLAGGQSLLPLLNLRMARCEALVDIGRIAVLTDVKVTGDVLCLGALVRHTRLEHDPDIRSAHALLAHVVGHIGHRAIRNHGTIGGSIAHADPSAELPATLLALRGSVIAVSTSGRREIHADDLFVNHFQTSLADNELLTLVQIPLARPTQSWGFYEYAPRSGDFAQAGAIVTIDRSEAAPQVAVTWFATGATPTRVVLDELSAVANQVSAGASGADPAVRKTLTDAYDRSGSDSGKQMLAVTVATRAFQRAAQSNPAVTSRTGGLN